MKTKSILVGLLLMVAGLQIVRAQKIILHLSDKQKLEYELSKLDSITFAVHEWVDLGLPSGTLWATCNVGAESPEEYGEYYAWGETEPKEEYYWNTYKLCEGWFDSFTKYCPDSSIGYNGFKDGLMELLPEDDAATANWGSDWQIPSLEQCKELRNQNNTTCLWTEQNGVKGHLIVSKNNGNSLFLPAAGYKGKEMSLNGEGNAGFYWTNSIGSAQGANYLHFNHWNEIYPDVLIRCAGLSIRPVRKK